MLPPKHIFLFIFFVLSNQVSAAPKLVDGVLDCRGWNFQENGYFEIKGTANFYWKQLVDPRDFAQGTAPSSQSITFPELWNKSNKNIPNLSPQGYATYHFTILTDPNTDMFAFDIPDMYSSYSLWVDGVLLAKNGTVGMTKEEMTPYWLPMIRSFIITKPRTEVVIQLANFHHSKGGITHAIAFGKQDQLLAQREHEAMYAFLLTGIFLMGGLFFLSLYRFGKENKSTLYFALFCFVYSYRMVGCDLYILHQYLPHLPWWFTIKLEYLSLFLSTVFFLEFSKHTFPQDINQQIGKAYQVISLALAGIVIITPAIFYTQITNYYLVILFSFIGYGTYVCIQALWNKRDGISYIMLGLFFLLVSFGLAVTHQLGFTDSYPFAHFICYLLFFFFLSLNSSRQFAMEYMRLANAANSASRAKTDFLATMSHEIRTPMNGVLGMTQLLAQTELTEEQKYFVDVIRSSGDNLTTIIDEILDFTHIDSGKIELELKDFRVGQIIVEATRLFAMEAQKKKLQLNLNIDSKIPDYINGDPMRIKQILLNLVENALKFTHNGRVEVASKVLSQRDDSVEVQFDVIDTGIGIPSAKVPLLFQEFQQADSSSMRKYGGAGLGLAISQKLVDLMGGKIWVTSQEGQGSTFSFILPLKISTSQAQKEQVAQKKRTPDGRQLSEKIPMNILLVEDNMINQKLVLMLLKKLGYKTDVAANGKEAVVAVEAKDYDLIFMDIQMPEMDGIEATRIIFDRYAADEVRPIIVALTANVLKEDRDRCFEVGMDDFITKPLKPGTISDVIVKWGEKIGIPDPMLQEGVPS